MTVVVVTYYDEIFVLTYTRHDMKKSFDERIERAEIKMQLNSSQL